MQKYNFLIGFDGRQYQIVGTKIIAASDYNVIEGRRLIIKDGDNRIADFPFVRTAVISAVKWPKEGSEPAYENIEIILAR